jgi:hypothetical protein
MLLVIGRTSFPLLVVGVMAGLIGWGLLLWNPKTKKQWLWASLMILFLLAYLIFAR